TTPSRPPGVPRHDADLLTQVLAEAGRTPPRRPPHAVVDDASPEDLRRLHHDQGLGLTEIANRLGSSPRTVRARLEREGIEVRHRRGRRGTSGIAADRRERLAGLYDRAGVQEALGRHRVPTGINVAPPDPPVDLTAGLISDLYVGIGLSGSDIALLTARSHGAVQRAMRHHGIDVRRKMPRPPPPRNGEVLQLDRDTLVGLAADGRDAPSIAIALGLHSPTTVRIAAQVLEVALPGDPGPPPVPSRVLREVRRAGVSAAHAGAVLDPRHLGVGAARGLPPWPWPPGPPLLRHLYRSLGIGLVECADRLRCDVDDLKGLFATVGIALRRLDEPQPTKRWRLDPAELQELYVEQGRSVDNIAEHIGVNSALVYRALHRHHLPVATNRARGDVRVRYDELLGDSRVREALAAAGLTPAGIDPPIRRTPLPPTALAALVGDLGLSTFDLELLTGRLTRSVRQDCENAGIEPRWLPPGVTADRLRDLYEAEGLSMSRICDDLGLRSHAVLRTALRRAGIPRRSGRANPWDTRRL
ncbi:MAG: hypothetical protein ACRDPR_07785, partial [Nocardioidaceae bacterium]